MEKARALESRVALVTGASRGIGLAIATRLGRLGARVALNARRTGPLEEATTKLRGEGIEAMAVAGDVRRQEQVTAMVQECQRNFGPIEILVNNAGVGVFHPIHELGEAQWESAIETNLKAVFLLSKAVAPEMIRRRNGFIINIGSLAGKNAFAGGAAYCASKWGLMGLTYCMAEDLRGHGIRVSVVCPGTVATEFSPHLGKDPSKMLQPDDVAHAVEMILTAAPQSFLSEIDLRPTQKP